MRILYIAWDGTAWRKTLVEGMQKAGHTVIPLYRFKSFNRYTFAISAFIRALSIPFDVLLADFASFGYLGAKICQILKKPLVVYARGGDVDTKDPDFGIKGNVNWVKYGLKNAQIIITVSRYLMDRILELYPESKEKIRLVYNGIDVNRFIPDNHKFQFNLLDVGNILIYKKGLDTLIEALLKIIEKYPNTQFTHVGKDICGDKEKLLAIADKLNVSDHIVFKGFISDEELIRIYQKSDIFVHSARQEQFGVVLLEAMASGLPVIGGDAGGIPEVVPRDSLVSVDKPDVLAEKIIKLFALNDQERWKIGKRNRAIVQRWFTSDHQVNGVINALDEAISKYKNYRYLNFTQEIETRSGTLVKRKIGEGSFIGLCKKHNTLEELVQWLKHLYAYNYAESYSEAKQVLDIGCGTGYGINELAKKANVSIGIDIWKEGINYCYHKYGKNTFFLMSSGLDIPFRDGSFEVIVSFQVIEHIYPNLVIKYLGEIDRVLKNNGTFIVTTPNKKIRLLPFQKPWNLDHKKEYDAKELENMLKSIFKNVEIKGLFAKKDAYLVDYNRVKQNPIIVYPYLLAKHLLPTRIISILKLANKKRNATKISENISHSLSLKDFNTSRQNLEACIDLYGLCKK